MSLKNIVYLSEADFTTLSTSGSLTKGGQTLTYDPLNDVYCVPSQTEKHLYIHNINMTSSSGSAHILWPTSDPTIINTEAKLRSNLAGKGYFCFLYPAGIADVVYDDPSDPTYSDIVVNTVSYAGTTGSQTIAGFVTVTDTVKEI